MSTSGPKPFHFRSDWLEHTSLADLIFSSWHQSISFSCPMHATPTEAAVSQNGYSNVELFSFGDVNDRVISAKRKLASTQQQISINGGSEFLFNEEDASELKVFHFVCMHTNFFERESQG